MKGPDQVSDAEQPSTPEILTGAQKARIAAVLSTLTVILAFTADYVPAPWSTVLLGLAGLTGVIGVPWGVYITRNKITVVN